jgi:2-polyprenyl-3-methyl-5-hydroxy-6-metoxy-1,4-benzoquinol methylase
MAILALCATTITGTAIAEDDPAGPGSQVNRHMHRHDIGELIQRFEDPDRDTWQKPEWVIDQLGNLAGKTVADLGAGSGYLTFRLAQRGAEVLALDIDERFLEHIRKKNQGLNPPLPIETRLVKVDDSLLKKGEADIVLIVNTYHHIGDRVRYVGAVRETLAPGGMLAVVDYKKQEIPMGPPMSMRLSPPEVIEELLQAGYTHFELDAGTLEYQYLILAQ